jgi:hypothetical protein
MTIRADISRNYLMRLGLVGLFCFAGGLYFYYDGLVGYPAWQERGKDYQKFIEENSEMDELDRLNLWKERAAEKGWPQENPFDSDTNKPISDQKITDQFVWGTAACLIGLCFLSRLAYMFHRWVECDDSSLRDKAGHETAYGNITQLNKKKWDSKGIAFVHYKANGGTGKIRLDDFYFDREATRQILRKVEANTDPALITNGKPEPPEASVGVPPAGGPTNA